MKSMRERDFRKAFKALVRAEVQERAKAQDVEWFRRQYAAMRNETPEERHLREARQYPRLLNAAPPMVVSRFGKTTIATRDISSAQYQRLFVKALTSDPARPSRWQRLVRWLLG